MGVIAKRLTGQSDCVIPLYTLVTPFLVNCEQLKIKRSRANSGTLKTHPRRLMLERRWPGSKQKVEPDSSSYLKYLNSKTVLLEFSIYGNRKKQIGLLVPPSVDLKLDWGGDGERRGLFGVNLSNLCETKTNIVQYFPGTLLNCLLIGLVIEICFPETFLLSGQDKILPRNLRRKEQ